ncbi:MAG: DUF3822 family protein [Saprospiraceae bacterium]
MSFKKLLNDTENFKGYLYSTTKKFQFVEDVNLHPNELLFPVFPNENLNITNSKFKIVYAQKKSITVAPHITSELDLLIDLKECEDKNCTFIHFMNHKVLIMNRRLNEILYCNIFNYNSVEELLYHICSIFQILNLNTDSNYLILQGNIEEDSIIVNRFKIYFKNLKIKSS